MLSRIVAPNNRYNQKLVIARISSHNSPLTIVGTHEIELAITQAQSVSILYRIVAPNNRLISILSRIFLFSRAEQQDYNNRHGRSESGRNKR